MAIYLDEDMVGSDDGFIAFPHLLLCMGVVVLLDDGSMTGAHFTSPSTEQQILNAMRGDIDDSGQGMSELYCAANLAEHVGHHGGLDINGKAAGLGFHGQGYIFDFGYLNPTDGAYVQFTSNGGGNNDGLGKGLSVRFRLNENMNYAKGGNGPPVYKPGSNGARRQVRSVLQTTGATVTDGQDLLTPFMKPVTIA